MQMTIVSATRWQVGKAHGLLAKLFRISKEQPAPLRPQGVTEGRFAPVLFDYRYFKEKAALEAKIEATPELQQLDDQFREVGMSGLDTYLKTNWRQ